MSHHEPGMFGAIHDAGNVVPAMTLAEYLARMANATRPIGEPPIGEPPIGARRRPGSSPTWGDFA